MPKLLYRIIALLLVPCLLQEPAQAFFDVIPVKTGIHMMDFHLRGTDDKGIPFAAQALAPPPEGAQRYTRSSEGEIRVIHILESSPERPNQPEAAGDHSVPAMQGPGNGAQLEGFSPEEEHIIRGTLAQAVHYLPGFNELLDDPQIEAHVIRVASVQDYVDQLAQQDPSNPLWQAYARELRQEALTGHRIDSLTLVRVGPNGRLISETLIQPDIFEVLGRPFQTLFHEMSHVTLYRDHANEILQQRYSLTGTEEEYQATQRGIAAMEAMTHDPSIQALNSPTILALQQPGGPIDQEKQMLAYWNSQRSHGPSLPWIAGGTVSSAAGLLGALALWRYQRGIRAQAQTNWRRVFYWVFISIALLTGVLAILHGFHVIDLPSWLTSSQTSSIGGFNTDHAALGGSAMAVFVTRHQLRMRSYGRLFGLTLIATLMFGIAPSLWSQTKPPAPPPQLGASGPTTNVVRTQRLSNITQINTVSQLIEEFVQWRIDGGEPPWQDDAVVAQFFNSSREMRFDGYLEAVDYVASFDRTIFFLERPRRGQQGTMRATYSEEGYGIYLALNSNGVGTRPDAFVSATPDGRFLIEKTGDSPYLFKVTPLPADPGSEAYYHRLAATDPAKIFAQFDQLATRPWGPEVILRAGEAMPDEIVRILIEGSSARRQVLRGILQKTQHAVLPRLLDIASGPYSRDIKLRLALLVEKMGVSISSYEAQKLSPEDAAFQKRLETFSFDLAVAAEVAGNESVFVRLLQSILEDSTTLNNPPRGYASIIQYLKSHNQPLKKAIEHGELTVPSGNDQTEVTMAAGLGLRYIPELAKLADENRFHASVYFTDDILASLQKIARERPNDPLTQKYVENQTRLAQTSSVKFDALTLIGENGDGTLEVMTIIDPSNMKSEAALVAAEVHEEAHVAVIFRHLDAWREGTYPASIAENEIETCDLTIKALEAAVADPELQKTGPNLINALRGSEGIERETTTREMWRKQLPVPQIPHGMINQMDWFLQNPIPQHIQQFSKRRVEFAA